MSLLSDIRSVSDSPHAAVLWSEGRRGLKDLQDAVLVAFPDSMKSRDEAGTIANPTSQLVTEDMKGVNVDTTTDTISQEVDFRSYLAQPPAIEHTPSPEIEMEPS